MVKITKAIIFIYILIIPSIIHALPTGKITLKVVDENGAPIEDAKAAANFNVGGSGRTDKDITDSDGLATLSSSGIRHVEYGAHIDGYYRTVGEYDFDDLWGIIGIRRWQPWNPTITVVLKKKINPTSLYAKSLLSGNSIKIPKLNEPIGFDLKEGDWVIPYGSGLNKDFIFLFEGEQTARRTFDYTLSLFFPNEGDGIQSISAEPRFGSELRLSYEAPASGYKKELNQRYARTPKQFLHHDFPEDRNYFFRVRTENDEEGNIINALYGKIHGNIRFDFENNISFQYYLNPNSNDRNLEFDYKKNLFDTRDKYGRYEEYAP